MGFVSEFVDFWKMFPGISGVYWRKCFICFWVNKIVKIFSRYPALDGACISYLKIILNCLIFSVTPGNVSFCVFFFFGI
jgi:hypothetical protein